jgi:hypothetical protein
MHTNLLLNALMNLRRGRVLTPTESIVATGELQGAHRLDGYSVRLGVPHWFFSQLENTRLPQRHAFAVVTNRKSDDAMLTLAVQAGATQLRLLMHLNYADVQALVQDVMARGQLDLLLDIEHRQQASILSAPLPDGMEATLPYVLDAARDKPGEKVVVLTTGAFFTEPKALKSLMPDETVSDVVTALVTGEIEELSNDEWNALAGSAIRSMPDRSENQHLH